MIFLYTLALVAITVCLASVVPVAQYLYYTFIEEDNHSIRYYFSRNLFDRHLQERPNLARVINNRDEMGKLWEKEMAYELP